MGFTDTRLIEVQDADLDALRGALTDARDAVDGDSNDEEIDALWRFVNIASPIFGLRAEED